jgi:twitching motility protein PilI
MNLSAQQALEIMQRNYAHDAVSIPAPQEQVTHWVGTHLGVAGIDVLIGEGEIDEIIETPPTTVIPGTQPWVMGLAAHQGSLLPIVNGDALLRKDVYEGLVREYTMVIRRPGTHFGITLSQVFRHLKLPIQHHAMDIEIDDHIAKYCLGGFHKDGKSLAVLDIQKLIAESGLSDASITRRELNEESSNG